MQNDVTPGAPPSPITPPYFLRDLGQNGEAWKDLERVMAELGLKPLTKLV